MKLSEGKREQIIKEVKKSKEKWRTEKVLAFDGYFGNDPYKEWHEMLINNDAKLEYKEDTIVAARGKHLIIVKDKMYEKSDFSTEEWTEIEKMLEKNKSNNHKETSPENSSSFFSKEVMIGIGVALLIFILGIVIFRKKRH